MIKLDLAHRSTTDIVVILFTLLICVILLITITGALIAKLTYPDMDLTKVSDSINQMLSTIVGALVGFISGRAMGRHEEREFQERQNGEPK